MWIKTFAEKSERNRQLSLKFQCKYKILNISHTHTQQLQVSLQKIIITAVILTGFAGPIRSLKGPKIKKSKFTTESVLTEAGFLKLKILYKALNSRTKAQSFAKNKTCNIILK